MYFIPGFFYFNVFLGCKMTFSVIENEENGFYMSKYVFIQQKLIFFRFYIYFSYYLWKFFFKSCSKLEKVVIILDILKSEKKSNKFNKLKCIFDMFVKENVIFRDIYEIIFFMFSFKEKYLIFQLIFNKTKGFRADFENSYIVA